MGTILSIDYGEKRIGAAISDMDEKFAMPLKILEVKSEKEALEKVKTIVQKYEVTKILIGLPLNSDNEDTANSLKIKDFIKVLKSELGIEIETVNEFLSSAFAENTFKTINYHVKHIDSEVARNQLQEYLNYKNKNHG